jgi:hypothetical protein
MDESIHPRAHQSKHSLTCCVVSPAMPENKAPLLPRHLLSLVDLLILCSFGSPLADLHLVFSITEKHLATTPPPSALPPAGILAALASIGGVSVP